MAEHETEATTQEQIEAYSLPKILIVALIKRLLCKWRVGVAKSTAPLQSM